jgi:aromatic-L-amino-acid/L-tryptophan decarboxylase
MRPLELSPADFHRLATRVSALATEFFKTIDQRPTFPQLDASENDALFRTPAPEIGLGEKAFDALEDVLRRSRIQNGRFFGYVLGSGEPVAALGDLIASVVNQNVTAWRSGPAAVTIEKTVIDWLTQALGCGSFRGSFTGGGSSANLMALAMAREAISPANEGGLRTAPELTLYASTEAHMSIGKAAALLGIGRENLRLIAADEEFKLNPERLEAAVVADQKAGKKPLAVIASAGTVNTGSIDPLSEIAAIARRHGMWFHIDGAYGALAAMAVPDKFRGLAEANSISLDPHKWLYQPLDCSCILYRDFRAGESPAEKAFSHTGDYARSLSQDPIESFAFFEETVELSRRFRALKLWLSLRYHGFDAFRAAIGKDLELAQVLAKRIEAEPTLELMSPVELSAVCFRHRRLPGKGLAQSELSEQVQRTSGTQAREPLNEFNSRILKRLIERGRVYLSNATLRGHFCLRACLVNHRTTEGDIAEVVSEVLAVANEIV